MPAYLVLLNKVGCLKKELGVQLNNHTFLKRKLLYHLLNRAWKNARKKSGLTQVRVHDLKHTFGRRLRSAGVSFEDRQDLLGHKSTRITTHYSAAEVLNLLNAANKVCGEVRKPTLTLLRSEATDGGHEKVTKVIF